MKKDAQALSLALLQSNIEASSRELRAAQTAYVRAADRLTNATESHTSSVVALNQGVASVKSACAVTHLMGK